MGVSSSGEVAISVLPDRVGRGPGGRMSVRVRSVRALSRLREERVVGTLGGCGSCGGSGSLMTGTLKVSETALCQGLSGCGVVSG